MKTSPSDHLCNQGKKPVTSRQKSDLMGCSEPLALVRHDQTLMQLSWMLKYYGEQRPSSCRTSNFKCVLCLQVAEHPPSNVLCFKLQNLHLQMCCAFKLQNLHFQMCLCLQVAEPPPSNVLCLQVAERPPSNVLCLQVAEPPSSNVFCLQVAEPPLSNVFARSSCRTSAYKYVCAFKLQNLHLQMCLCLT